MLWKKVLKKTQRKGIGESRYARMSEWSKEPDLRPGSVSCVGSNPTSCKEFPV